MKESIRCYSCNKLLGLAENDCTIEIKCSRCKSLNSIVHRNPRGSTQKEILDGQSQSQ
ncbi:MAG: Com family DNA-binding transcriptional regulator [Candidatus Pacebacteria bacterium]|nr:Com family DNA-binding transcriptional regulator [Candidatus Paceibacterota bacterium]